MLILSKIKNLDSTYAKKAPIGFSKDDVYIIDKGYFNKDVVVKISTRKEVLEEGKNLQWLDKHIAVPKVYELGYEDNYYYIIMEKLSGTMFQELFTTYSLEAVVKKYALLIKQFHQIPYNQLPYNHNLENKLLAVKTNVETGKVKEQYFEREFRHLHTKQMYELLLQNQVAEDHLVLCHGDVCMPNIMMEGMELSGFIDVMNMGVCDRYLDIAIALRTLRYNFELYGYTFTKEYQDIFCKTYGITELNQQKLFFYIILDELSND